MRRRTARRMVIGLGNPDRGDDAAGPACLAALRGRLPPDVELIESDGEPVGLLTLLGDATEAYLIDACISGAAAGTVRRLEPATDTLPAWAAPPSSHGLGVAETLELARALGELPRRCVVYAIEGLRYEVGAPLSAPVRSAVAAVAAHIAGVCDLCQDT